MYMGMETNALQTKQTDSFLTHPSPLVVGAMCQMVNLLIAKGANINAFDKKDGRALHWAAFMGKKRLKLYSSHPLVARSFPGRAAFMHNRSLAESSNRPD